jgi:pyruvate dehydrogenase E1 component alpha subunit
LYEVPTRPANFSSKRSKMLKKIKTFEINSLQVLDEFGKVDTKLAPKLTNAQLLELYKTMALCRKADEKVLIAQRQGRLGTYASYRGQEASQVGSAYALSDADWLVPTYRDAAALITRKTPLSLLLLYTGGDERGSVFPKGVNNLPIAVPVGTQGLHAAGLAMAATIQKKKFAALAYFGDGATSEGDMHEAFNFASVFKAPVIFLCQNNQYAISTPYREQTGAETIAQKAIAYGMECIRVDGNDVLGVYKATKDALARAYAGKGPTLIECLTYRMSNHTTSDDASKYRSAAEVKAWEAKDPILRLKKLLEKKNLWNAKKESALQNEIAKKISTAMEEYENTPPQPVEDMFRYLYEDLPLYLKEQMEEAKRFENG